jgi:beta-N-acetylhexosaminidase
LTEDGTLLGDTIRRRGVPCAEVVVDLGSTASKAAALRQARELAPNAAWLLVGTWQAGSWQAHLVRDLLALGKPLLAVAFGTPYDLAHFADVATFVAAFGNAEANVEAVAKVIFGELCPVGTLPVSIPGLYEVGHGLGFPSIPCERVERE